MQPCPIVGPVRHRAGWVEQQLANAARTPPGPTSLVQIFVCGLDTFCVSSHLGALGLPQNPAARHCR